MTIGYQDKLKAEIEICKLHEDRLRMSLKHILPLLPLTRQFFDKAQDEDLAFLDMVAMRFAKLQDALRKKVFDLDLKNIIFEMQFHTNMKMILINFANYLIILSKNVMSF